MVVSDRVISSGDINLTDKDLTAVEAMITAEASRQAAETGRVNSEAQRQTNEGVRQDTLGQLDAAIKKIDDKIAEMERRAESGEFDGEDGEDGTNGTLADYKILTSLDPSNYKLTISLTDTDENIINSSIVDLPRESVVVALREENGIVTLTLQNGNESEVYIGDLVDGFYSKAEVDERIANHITGLLNGDEAYLTELDMLVGEGM